MTFTFRDNWDQIRRRYESWWEGEPVETPMLRVTAPRSLAEVDLLPEPAPEEEEELYAWFTDPSRVLPRLERIVASTCYAGDAFPWIDPMSQGLAAIQAAYLGAPYRIDPHTLTGWTSPLFNDPAERPRFEVDPDNQWWMATRRLLEEGARQGGGRYIISIPDIQGGGEILALLRGSEGLALDLFDCPEWIPPALVEINASWLGYYNACYEIIHHYQPGYVDWLGIWSEKPAVTVECDFSVMISPRMFERYFLPAVAWQVDAVDRAVFHLDGPGATPHLEALLSLPRLKGIQWVPTPARPRPSDWIPLLQRIQAAGKRVVVACAPDEVLLLLGALDPQLLMLNTTCASHAEADALVGEAARRFGRRKANR
jgi:hypothetical protein